MVYFQATFEAHFNDPGDFLVTVQSLPLPNKGYTQRIENVFTKTNYSTYPIQMWANYKVKVSLCLKYCIIFLKYENTSL